MYEITHRPTQFSSHRLVLEKFFPKKTHTHAHRAKKNFFTQFIFGMIFNAISEWWDILTDSYLDLSHTVMSSNFGWIWYLNLEKMWIFHHVVVWKKCCKEFFFSSSCFSFVRSMLDFARCQWYGHENIDIVFQFSHRHCTTFPHFPQHCAEKWI